MMVKFVNTYRILAPRLQRPTALAGATTKRDAFMSSKRERLSNNIAGIEFLACLEIIKEFLQKSWKHSQIHRHLKQEGKVTMSYGAFCYHMRRLSMEKHRPGEPLPAAPVKKAALAPLSVRPVGPRHITPSSNKFPDPRDMNPDDAI